MIDKDLAASLLARQLEADMLLILTAVPYVYVNYGTPDQMPIGDVHPDELISYLNEGQFAPGSMRPKIEAALEFASSKPGRLSVITGLERASEAVDSRVGTRIYQPEEEKTDWKLAVL